MSRPGVTLGKRLSASAVTLARRSYFAEARLRAPAKGAFNLPRFLGFRRRGIEGELAPQNATKESASTDGLLAKLQQKAPVRVSVTGAAGAIGYALLFRIANGELLGPDQPVILNCIELPMAMDAMRGVAMELEDCAFPLVHKLNYTDNPDEGFAGCDIALLVGSKPRGPGMERGDLIRDNGGIFQKIGKVLNDSASKHCRVTVVGNPCNTNALICANNAPNIPIENFTAMTRLDHDRAVGMLTQKTTLPSNEVQNFCIWGNHSPTMFPDLSQTRIHGVPAEELIGSYRFDRYWMNELMPMVQQRGADIIKARGASSAASAASACIAHTRDWCLGTEKNDWVSMATPSQGQYGVPAGLVFSFPTLCQNGVYAVADYQYPISERLGYHIERNVEELLQERDIVSSLLPN